MTPKQALFVQEYLVDFNATQAAIRAGYSRKTANRIASQLLTKVDIQEAVRSGREEREKRVEVSQDRILVELCRIAFSDLRDVAEWQDGNLEIKSSGDLEAGAAACLAEVSQSASGLKVKLHKKEKALELLMRHMGMLNDKLVHVIPDSLSVVSCESKALAARERLRELRDLRAEPLEGC